MWANWTFLTSHARLLLCIAHDPGFGRVTSRPAWASPSAAPTAFVTDLAEAGYMVTQKDGRRNRCQIHAHLPLPVPDRRERTVGQALALLAGTDTGLGPRRQGTRHRRRFEAGRRLPTRAGRARSGRTSGPSVDNAAIRVWAKTAGLQVSERGRISADVIRQYEAARFRPPR